MSEASIRRGLGAAASVLSILCFLHGFGLEVSEPVLVYIGIFLGVFGYVLQGEL